ncbi:peroxidase P7-like [Zingiber officinale]|uniref:peroxidase P7-like n=1 Tax=Zingiber officinale TaxID=94328 RepID=UPI001C4BE17F|nr:peroxidase P7-like [Zingiber officinale]
MAFSSSRILLGLFLLCSSSVVRYVHAQFLSPDFYNSSCPGLVSIVQEEMRSAVAAESRMGASVLRLFYHDCFVSGCDASVLLDDTPAFAGEKNAIPNAQSLRGYEVIDGIKEKVEAACPAIVSCADILALAAREGTILLGGPSWMVQLGRRDATTASQSAANKELPSPSATLNGLISLFVSKGFSAQDMTALSGAHTLGFARCVNFRSRLYGDADVDPAFAAQRRQSCPAASGFGDDNWEPLDAQSPAGFDSAYYQNLMLRQGLLRSDQELFNGGSQDSVVTMYSNNAAAFRNDFAAAMEKMAGMSPMTWPSGQIRLNCRRVN